MTTISFITVALAAFISASVLGLTIDKMVEGRK